MFTTSDATDKPEPIYHELYYPRPKNRSTPMQQNETSSIGNLLFHKPCEKYDNSVSIYDEVFSSQQTGEQETMDLSKKSLPSIKDEPNDIRYLAEISTLPSDSPIRNSARNFRRHSTCLLNPENVDIKDEISIFSENSLVSENVTDRTRKIDDVYKLWKRSDEVSEVPSLSFHPNNGHGTIGSTSQTNAITYEHIPKMNDSIPLSSGSQALISQLQPVKICNYKDLDSSKTIPSDQNFYRLDSLPENLSINRNHIVRENEIDIKQSNIEPKETLNDIRIKYSDNVHIKCESSNYDDLRASLASARDEARKTGSHLEEEFIDEWMNCLHGAPGATRENLNRHPFSSNYGAINFPDSIKPSFSADPLYVANDAINVISPGDRNAMDIISHGDRNAMDVISHGDRNLPNLLIDVNPSRVPYDSCQIIDNKSIMEPTYYEIGIDVNDHTIGNSVSNSVSQNEGVIAELLDMSQPQYDPQLSQVVQSELFTAPKSCPKTKTGPYKRR